MRNLLALAALGLIVFLGLGWHLGWFEIQSTPTADGHNKISIDLDTNKIKSAVIEGENKIHDALSDKNNANPQNPAVP